MISKDKRRRWIVAGGIVVTGILGISYFGKRGNFAEEQQSAPLAQATWRPTGPASTPPPLLADTSLENPANSGDSSATSAIAIFHGWAETTAASGFTQADEKRGLDLAIARAGAMKALILRDPASALRQALPADLRASLPKTIAAAIEQPVKTTGMCSMRMMCNHSPDVPHGGCEAIPVLLEEIDSWNAHYGEQQWKAHLGKTVGFDGIAVDEELAVRSITPVSSQ